MIMIYVRDKFKIKKNQQKEFKIMYSYFQDKNCVKQIYSYLLDHCREVSSKSQYETFKNILEDPSKPVGLVISERFVNIPGKISVPLYHNLRFIKYFVFS